MYCTVANTRNKLHRSWRHTAFAPFMGQGYAMIRTLSHCARSSRSKYAQTSVKGGQNMQSQCGLWVKPRPTSKLYILYRFF